MTAEQIARRYVDTLSDETCRELLALALCAVCPALHSIATTSSTNRLNKMDDMQAVHVTPDFSELFNVGSNVGRKENNDR